MKFKNIAFQVDIARQMENPLTLKEIIDFGGQAGYNELFLYGEGALEYKSHPSCSYPWALTQKEFIDLQDYAGNNYNMCLIPIIPTLGHANFILNNKELEFMREVKKPQNAVIKCNQRQFCTSNPGTYKIIEELLAEWAEISAAPYLHIGGDESWNFAACPECRRKAEKTGRGKMLAEHFNKVNAIVRKHHKQTMIWHDMLFYFDDCLPHLDKDIVICDWHYEPIERHPGISIYNWSKTDFNAEYKKQNLSFFICPRANTNYREDSANIRSFIQYSCDHNSTGFLNTVWEMSEIPYASSYPSLAYGAACCLEDNLPDSRIFLRQFVEKHFSGNTAVLPLLIDLFGEAANVSAFTGLDDWIDYQDPYQYMFIAGKLEEGIELLEEVQGKTVAGKAYRDALELVFRRTALSKRLQGTVSEIARLYLTGSPGKSTLMNLLEEVSVLIDKIPDQIKLEQKIWKRARPRKQKNRMVEKCNAAKTCLLEFVKSVRGIISGQISVAAVFPAVLELTLVNNDCSWQYLSIFASETGRKYHKVGSYPQCGPFGRYIKTFRLPSANGNYIKLELGGLGQLLIHYARVIGPGLEFVPEKIIKSEGAVSNPENILNDDFKPAVMGTFDSKDYFSSGCEQPRSVVEIKITKKL
jgi:hypothetical protein